MYALTKITYITLPYLQLDYLQNIAFNELLYTTLRYAKHKTFSHNKCDTYLAYWYF